MTLTPWHAWDYIIFYHKLMIKPFIQPATEWQHNQRKETLFVFLILKIQYVINIWIMSMLKRKERTSGFQEKENSYNVPYNYKYLFYIYWTEDRNVTNIWSVTLYLRKVISSHSSFFQISRYVDLTLIYLSWLSSI